MSAKTVTTKVDCVSCIIYDSKGQVLLQKKTHNYKPAPGKWLLFGGRIEPEESPLMAIARELTEKLSVDMYPTFFEETPYRAPLDNRRGIEHVFRYKMPNELSDLTLTDGAGFALFHKRELMNEMFMPHQIKSLRRFYKWSRKA